MRENQHQTESDSEVPVSNKSTEFDEITIPLEINTLNDIQNLAMRLVKARFEQGPEQNDIHEILFLVWIG